MAEKVIYHAKRRVRTFVDLYRGACGLRDFAQSGGAGSYFITMSSLLMAAFTFEAYLNDLGMQRIPFWAEIERIGVLEKYAVLNSVLELLADQSRRPDQTIQKLFKFRNAIAHGKSVMLEETREVGSGFQPPPMHPRAHWEEFCTTKNAIQVMNDVDEIIHRLHKAAGLGDDPFRGGIAIFSVGTR